VNRPSGELVSVSDIYATQLDNRNAQSASIGADFSRFALEFWVAVEASDMRNGARREKLRRLMSGATRSLTMTSTGAV
jgi:hypothetical protein